MESFNAFLSHKYNAPMINEFFFRIFSQVANVQFEVDDGKTSTNVTRLERMIREADAFIGIYPFEATDEFPASTENLKKSSQYFRLELDLAARAQKPAMIFTDSRYGTVLSTPPSISHETFNHQEIIALGAKPSAARFSQAFQYFSDRVIAAKKFHLAERPFERVSGQVGILLPMRGSPESYGNEHIELLKDRINEARFDPIILDWPPLLTPTLIGKIRTFDWMVVDVGPETVSTGIVGYLHGASIPTMRLLKTRDLLPPPEAPTALYGGVNVGYGKDILRWSKIDALGSELAKRLSALDFKTRRISTLDEAVDYFLEATLRKETVFISYAGDDLAESENLRTALSRRFQQVFDYRNGKSIAPGENWVSEIYDQLGRSAVGIPLLSSNYKKSGHCMHELRQMIALKDDGVMRIFPIKLTPTDNFDLPSEIQVTQITRTSEYRSANELVNWLVLQLDNKKTSSANT